MLNKHCIHWATFSVTLNSWFSYLHFPRAGIPGELPFSSPFCLPSFSSVLPFSSFEPGSCHVAPVWPRTQNLALTSQVLGCRCVPLCPALAGMFSDELLINIFQNFIMSSHWSVISPQAIIIISTRIMSHNTAPMCLWLLLYYRPISFVLDTYLGT